MYLYTQMCSSIFTNHANLPLWFGIQHCRNFIDYILHVLTSSMFRTVNLWSLNFFGRQGLRCRQACVHATWAASGKILLKRQPCLNHCELAFARIRHPKLSNMSKYIQKFLFRCGHAWVWLFSHHKCIIFGQVSSDGSPANYTACEQICGMIVTKAGTLVTLYFI